LALGLGGDNTPLDRVVNSAGGIARNSLPFIIGEINRPASLVVFLLAAGLAVFLYRHARPDSRSTATSTADMTFNQRSRMYMAIVVLYVSIQVVVYTLTSAAAFFYPRYFILMAVLAVAVFAYLLYRLVLSGRSRLGAAIAVLVAGGALTTVAGWQGAAWGQRLNHLQGYNNGPCLEQVALARKIRMSGERVAALQTGTLAFFVEGAINLDGRVNFAAYEARKSEKLLQYVLDQGIGLLVDYDLYLQPGQFGYFAKTEDPKRYFQQVAPRGAPLPYDWVGLRRVLDAPRR
jgi:hypothetical protein